MFWSNVRNSLVKYGEVEEWNVDYMGMKSHDNICGLRLENKEFNISIISHKYSYGGTEDLFEIMCSLIEDDGIKGYLTEKEAIEYIDSIKLRINKS